MKKKMLVFCAMLLAGMVYAKEKSKPDQYFYVYQDKGSPLNHFIPSGWMGDFGDMKIDIGDTSDPADGKTAIKITYNAKAAQGANWAGIYWQRPANNWGAVKGAGYNLSAYKKVTFWAKADRAVKIGEFKVGGISGEFGDSDGVSSGPVDLTKEWKRFTIDITGHDFSYITGGFCWSASKDDNPEGFTLYLDDIRYEI